MTLARTTIPKTSFYRAILKWFDQHGRTHLPWQQDVTPYRVWVSEIMLQQTQVQTVIPYFERFMSRFPTIETLAKAPLDEVLHHWTGLGYYARARNLHKTAQELSTNYDNHFPTTLDAMITLPGIGRSTAGAILSLGLGQHAAILDGNVKRVLSRTHAVDGAVTLTSTIQQLWALAEYYTPKNRAADYNQAMMDLGSLVCTRTRPNCTQCPVIKQCLAHQTQRIEDFPARKAKVSLPEHPIFLLLLVHKNHVLLEQRPAQGIWGNLWSLPECPAPQQLKRWCKTRGWSVDTITPWSTIRHTFSHCRWHITPIVVTAHERYKATNENYIWYNLQKPASVGLAAPIKQLLQQVSQEL